MYMSENRKDQTGDLIKIIDRMDKNFNAIKEQKEHIFKLLLDVIDKHTEYRIVERQTNIYPYFRYAIFKNNKQITNYNNTKIQAINELLYTELHY